MTDEDLDGVAVAPANHRVIFENELVRVLETAIAAGEITPLHTHLAPTVMYVLSGSHFIRRDEHGATMVDTRANPDFVLPKVLFSASTPRHTLENTGVEDLVVIGVELKGVPRAESRWRTVHDESADDVPHGLQVPREDALQWARARPGRPVGSTITRLRSGGRSRWRRTTRGTT